MAGPSEEPQRNMSVSAGFCYSDGSYTGSHQPTTHLSGHHLQSFGSNHEIYNLTAGMEMIGFPSKNLHHPTETSAAAAAAFLWKSTVHGAGNHSSTKEMNSDFYQHEWNPQDWNPNPSRSSFLVEDDPSLRCVFPCEPNERPSQGLSLSLSSSNPSAIGLQSFELRQHGDSRFGPSSSNSSQVLLKNSKYLVPTQELLKEFCNLGTKQTQKKSSSEYQDEAVIKTQSLYSLDLIELQRRKAKLLQMLEEVDRRYKCYCHQMKCVVSSFESMAGNGSAAVYLSMASKAMSRHFRCLRDGIERQMSATKKAMGEMDAAAAPGTMKGETPRLRLIDQTLRQQRAMQHMNMMESHPWRPQRGLPERAVSILRAWLFEHFLHPYPCDVDKHILARQTGLSRSQVSNWFINARVRLWKPMVEEMYLEELKDGEGTAVADGGGENFQRNEDEKPSHDQLVRMDSECLSSIINNNNNAEKNELKKSKAIQHEQQSSGSGFVSSYSSYGAAIGNDFPIPSYGTPDAVNYRLGSGVSLTLGLHQHGGASSGMSLAFSPAAPNSLFYGRGEMEECQTGQYSLLDGENQTLPYRNLMGAQLLHDLAG